jgi:hypothetical protein
MSEDDRAKWRVGERVSRKTTGQRGMIDEVSEHSIKIKWGMARQVLIAAM